MFIRKTHEQLEAKNVSACLNYSERSQLAVLCRLYPVQYKKAPFTYCAEVPHRTPFATTRRDSTAKIGRLGHCI